MPLRKKRFFHLAGTLTALSVLAGCDGEAVQPASPPPPSVSVAEITEAAIPLRFQYAGRVAAFREVEIRARVAGILQEKSFVEGTTVKAGDVLFRIDPAPYEAEVARAKAQLMEAEAQLNRTRQDADRATTLFQRQYGTEKARDDAVAAYELAKAALEGAKAQLKTAEINLSYTTVTAPISGVTTLKVLPEGSLVGTGADNSLLTRISQLDPVYVNFSFTDAEMTEIRRLTGTGGSEQPTNGKLVARISFGDGETYDREGYVDFTDNSVDLQTGTIRARAVVPNPENRLRPGQFVRISIEGITRNDTVVIPQTALMQGPQGQFVYTVDAESKAAIRPVVTGREVDNGWIVEKGLKAGDRVVVEGVIKVKPGAPVASTNASAAEPPMKAALQ